MTNGAGMTLAESLVEIASEAKQSTGTEAFRDREIAAGALRPRNSRFCSEVVLQSW